LTENAPSGYWQPDYLADLEAILDRYAPGQAVNLLGHSLGANVAGIYAGVRPQRIAKLVLLDGFGRPAMAAEEAPQRYATWLDELRSVPLLRPYRSQEAVAARLQKNNPRLTKERAMFLAAHWASPNENGIWALRADARHKLTNPVLYRIEEVLACWRAITAPVLWVEAEHSELLPRFGTPAEIRTELERRIAQLANATILKVPDAGHMVQHDQPEILARAIDTFLA
ncbi:MAG TPA: alpha/beta hydrolase, partial [Oxalicibacterium sp.]